MDTSAGRSTEARGLPHAFPTYDPQDTLAWLCQKHRSCRPDQPSLCSGYHRQETKFIDRPCGETETRWPHASPPRIITGRCRKNQWRRNRGFRPVQWTGAPELLGSPSSGATEKNLGKTLGKIIKIVSTGWRNLRIKCTKFDFGWGSAPDPAGWAYSTPTDPLAGFGGLFAAGGGAGLGKRRERGGGVSGVEGKGGPPSYCWTRAPQSLATPLARTGPRFDPGWRRRPGRPRHSWIQQIGDGTPFSIHAEWSKARRRGHSGLTQRTSAVYSLYAIWRWWYSTLPWLAKKENDLIRFYSIQYYCTLASCGAVYCNWSCQSVGVCFSVIFVNENENENYQKRKNNDSVNEN